MSELPATYRKIRVTNMSALSFAEQTEIVEVPVEQPGPGEVLVKVAFAGVEASDILQNRGFYGALAVTPLETEANGKLQAGDTGCEGVGTVAAVGEGVALEVGATVFLVGYGIGFREYLTCPANQVIPVSVPASLEMAAIPISATTAAGALDISGRLSEGEQVLVTGAAGGTGQFAVQWAKAKYNARVVGVCGSAQKAQMLTEIGCDETINYKDEPDMAAAINARFPDGIDVAYEPVCGSLRDAVWANMGMFGRMICIGSVGDDYESTDAFVGHMLPSNSGLMKSLTCTSFFLFNLLGDPRLPQIIAEIMGYIQAGKIVARVDPASDSFKGLEGIYEAQKYIRTGQNAGKICVSL